MVDEGVHPLDKVVAKAEETVVGGQVSPAEVLEGDQAPGKAEAPAYQAAEETLDSLVEDLGMEVARRAVVRVCLVAVITLVDCRGFLAWDRVMEMEALVTFPVSLEDVATLEAFLAGDREVGVEDLEMEAEVTLEASQDSLAGDREVEVEALEMEMEVTLEASQDSLAEDQEVGVEDLEMEAEITLEASRDSLAEDREVGVEAWVIQVDPGFQDKGLVQGAEDLLMAWTQVLGAGTILLMTTQTQDLAGASQGRNEAVTTGRFT